MQLSPPPLRVHGKSKSLLLNRLTLKNGFHRANLNTRTTVIAVSRSPHHRNVVLYSQDTAWTSVYAYLTTRAIIGIDLDDHLISSLFCFISFIL